MKKRSTGKPFKKNDPITGARDGRINRKGAPKKTDSWAQSLRIIGDMDGPSIAAWGTSTAKEFGRLPEGLTLKVMVCLNAYASLFRDFSPSVWSLILERCDGKLSDELERRLLKLEALAEGKHVNN